MKEIQSQPKPHWAELPRPGCHHVEFRVLLYSGGLSIANLKFQTDAHIDEHDAPMDIDAIIIAGSGFVSIDGETAPVAAGQTVHWPKGKDHKLWTTTQTMETIMVERVYQVERPA